MNKIKPLPLCYKVTTNELRDVLYSYFKEKIQNGLEGPNYTIKKKDGRIEVSAQLAISIDSPLIELEKSAKLTTLEIENPYKISDKLKEIIRPFTKQNQTIKYNILTYNQGRHKKKKKFVIELDPIKTLWSVLEAPPEGFEYIVTGAVSQKNNSQLQLALRKKRVKKNTKK